MSLLRTKSVFLWGGMQENSTGSKNLESITNVQKSLTFLLRTTAQTAIFFCHQLSN